MASVGTSKSFNVPGLSDKLAEALVSICDEYDREDRIERLERRPLWLKLENYFNGLQRRYWDKTANDWRRLPDDAENETTRHYDKIINIYRAHAESVVAALSIKLPSAIFYPEDADVIEDIQTSQACVRIKQLIERHNSGKLLFIRILIILFNTGVCACYIYNRASKSYGIWKKPRYGTPVKVTTVSHNCPECGGNMKEEVFKENEKVKVKSDEVMKCEVCGYEGAPTSEKYEETIPKIVGYTEEPKSRTKLEAFSPLFVQMPFYARSQELMPYINLRFEQHYSLLKATYPKLAKDNGIPQGMVTDPDGSRIVDTNSSNLVTTECRWFRPWAFEIHKEDDVVKALKEKFPDGVYLVRLDRQIVEAHNESLDEHWEVSYSPLSTYIHADPIGKPLAPIQDLTNEVTDLQIETFEHAIPETFVDGEVLNFKKYEKSKAAPGMVYPVTKPKDGAAINTAFYTSKTATLSEETELFSRKLDEKGQFVLGSFPSIYGGPATSGSKTAREYTESRAMALQRLTITWTICKYFWAGIMGKAVPLYIRALKQSQQDEKFVDRQRRGNVVKFVNVWVRQSEITGQIGQVEADAEEDLPQSPAQIKDVLIQLMTLKDDHINEALYHPENTPMITKALGAPDFFIPGADDRDAEHDDISKILNGEPVEVKEWENHAIRIEVLQAWLISTTGLGVKTINSEGWSEVEAHMLAHLAYANPNAGPGAEKPAEEMT